MAKKEEKQKFGDIIENHDLIKRTLMVSAYPALIKSVVKDGDTLFEGFLPGFEFAEIEDMSSENECVEYLQDMLDDEVEELVVFGKSLPFVEEDDKLLKQYPDYKIVYLDINVYATKEELNYYDACSHNCSSCSEKCDEEEFYDDCYDEDCDCGCGHNHLETDDDCKCGGNHEDCNCNGNNHDGHCKCEEKHNNSNSEVTKNHNCKCSNNKQEKHDCKCKDKNKKHNCTNKKENKKS